MGINAGQPRRDRGDLHETALIRRRRHPHTIGVELGHPLVDPVDQLRARQLHPSRHHSGQGGIQFRDQRGVDSRRPVDDRGDHPKIDIPGGEHRRNPRQTLPQRQRVPDLRARPSTADVLRRRDLRGHLIERISTPQRTLSPLHRPPRIQLTHRRQPTRDRHRLSPTRHPHRVDQLGIRTTNQGIEHTFDIRCGHRQFEQP